MFSSLVQKSKSFSINIILNFIYSTNTTIKITIIFKMQKKIDDEINTLRKDYIIYQYFINFEI